MLNDSRSWWAEYCELKRKLEVVDSCATLRNCERDVYEEGWQEEVVEKSSLKWYWLAKEDFGQDRYVKEFGSMGEVRLRFRLRTVSAGLSDKEKCGMFMDGKCEV